MRFDIFNNLLKPYQVDDTHQSLMDACDKLTEVVKKLEERIAVLEQENISTTNELYRLENSLDARIDILAEHYGTYEDV